MPRQISNYEFTFVIQNSSKRCRVYVQHTDSGLNLLHFVKDYKEKRRTYSNLRNIFRTFLKHICLNLKSRGLSGTYLTVQCEQVINSGVLYFHGSQHEQMSHCHINVIVKLTHRNYRKPHNSGYKYNKEKVLDVLKIVQQLNYVPLANSKYEF